MDAFLSYIASHWVEWLFALVLAILGILYRSLVKKVKEDKEEDRAIAEGVQALLRNAIIEAYIKWTALGYCPIWAKDCLRYIYEAYHRLHGNDLATDFFNKTINLPETDPGGKE